jgi:DNA replication protein DnaC
VLLALVVERGIGPFFQQRVRFAIEHAVALLDGRVSDGLRDVALTASRMTIIDDLGMRKLPLTAAEELLEIIMRRYELASTLS